MLFFLSGHRYCLGVHRDRRPHHHHGVCHQNPSEDQFTRQRKHLVASCEGDRGPQLSARRGGLGEQILVRLLKNQYLKGFLEKQE